MQTLGSATKSAAWRQALTAVADLHADVHTAGIRTRNGPTHDVGSIPKPSLSPIASMSCDTCSLITHGR